MKQWYLSKTIWINLIALIGVALETVTGKEILDPATQGIILTVINLVLRIATRQGISFKQIENVINTDAAAKIWPDSRPNVDVKPIAPVQPTTPQTVQETPQTTQPDAAQATTEQPKV